MMNLSIVCVLTVLSQFHGAQSFVAPSVVSSTASRSDHVMMPWMAADTVSETSDSSTTSTTNLAMPLSWDEMIRQASSAIQEAAAAGQRRQIVRVLLPRDSASGDFGTYLESQANDNKVQVSLVPPDESWQGGIMQLYRAAAPTAQRMMQALTRHTPGGVPPRIVEDRSVDESGVDGVSYFQTDDQQVSCWLQPLQDNVPDILKTTTTKDDDDKTISLLMNPQWRLVDDALDSASKQEGFLGGLASFLGGKGGALRQLQDAGYVPVYTLEGYVCRGANVRLLQVRESDWHVFCERDDGESFVSVGTAPQRPTYQQVDELLNQADIGFKYARDIGMSPKL